jgi:hypothetical protein
MMTANNFFDRVKDSGFLAASHKPEIGEKISNHLTHPADAVTSPDTGEVWLDPQLLRLFDAARTIIGEPLRVSAGSRTIAHEQFLSDRGYKTTKFISPHTLSALDILTNRVNAYVMMNAFRQAATDLKLPVPRFGHRSYNDAWLHVDCVFLFFQPFTTLAHPSDWEELQDELRKAMGTAWRPGIEW